MNDQSKSPWSRMIQLIRDYDHQKLSFPQLVKSLEGATGSVELHDEEIIRGWNGLLAALQEFNSPDFSESEMDHFKIRPAVEMMRTFLIERNNQANTETFGENKVR